MIPSGTSTVMVRRLSAAVAPVRVAQPLAPSIQAGVPAGRSNAGTSKWRAIPKDLPPKSTVYDYFDLWTYDGTLDRIHHALYQQCRAQAQREASPTATIIDSQSVKSAEKGGAASIRRATMRARRSRARSGTFWSIH